MILILALALAVIPQAGKAFTFGRGAPGPGNLAIRDVSLRKASGDLTVSFRLAGDFPKDLEDTIQSGLPRTLSFRLELVRRRPLSPDEGLEAWQLRRTILYDNLKDEFLITGNVAVEGGSRPSPMQARVVKGFGRAMATAARVDDFHIPLAPSASPLHYLLRIRARVEPVEGGGLSWMDRLLFGLSTFGTRKTDWYEREFEF
jgi:hypothetical protein